MSLIAGLAANAGCPILGTSLFLCQGWDSTSPNRPFIRSSPTRASGLRPEWTNSVRHSRSVPHPFRVLCGKGGKPMPSTNVFHRERTGPRSVRGGERRICFSAATISAADFKDRTPAPNRKYHRTTKKAAEKTPAGAGFVTGHDF
jgi:hypothetical protein